MDGGKLEVCVEMMCTQIAKELADGEDVARDGCSVEGGVEDG